jgi:predicted ATP-binding protein involved in virulence
MYIKQIEIQNLGAIENLNIEAQFDEQGNPYPIILVGKNGTGKTLLLSNILDSFIELKRLKYKELNEVMPNKYLKLGSKSYIKSGKNYSFCKVTLSESEKVGYYMDFTSHQSGKDILKSNSELPKLLNMLNTSHSNFQENGFAKQLVINSLSLNVLDNNVLIFLPHSRYDHPAWLNNERQIGFEIKNDFIDQDKTNIIKTNILKEIEVWILDCMLDREMTEKRIQVINKVIIPNDSTPITVFHFLGYQGKNNNIITLLNQLFTAIYQAKFPSIDYASFEVSEKNRRAISVIVKEKNELKKYLAPSFSNLSSGEVMLLSLFASIIKEYDRLGKVFQTLSDIQGIVVIDEIDLHLHIEFQKTLLPQLIKIFPKVQFIITTHSPFFLMGMDKEFAGKCMFINMPEGNQIQVSQFSEVNVAYDVFTQGFNQMQKTFQEVNTKLQTITKSLVITEGKTDWKHLKNALRVLKGEGKYTNLDFDFFEYENEPQMGFGELRSICEKYAKIPNHSKKIICIFDRDEPDILKTMGDDNTGYKYYQNYVYSFCIPIPSHRLGHEKISIEHYYSDTEIKTYDKNSRRLFLSNEFSKVGRYEGGNNLILGNSNKFKDYTEDTKSKIIDTEVFDENDKNIALTKNHFAENILQEKEGFKNFNVNEFCKIFDIIEKIINS